MGNSSSSQRHLVTWGIFFLLLLPPPQFHVHSWNILPNYFGRNNPGGGATPPPAEMASALADMAAADPASSAAAAGPNDAPHLRYIPSYFSSQLPSQLSRVYPSFVAALASLRSKMYAVLWYKPPVGIVSVWASIRVWEKVYGVWCPPQPLTGEEVLKDVEGRMGKVGGGRLGGGYGPWGSVGKLYRSASDYKSGVERGQVFLQKKRKRRSRASTTGRKGRSFDLDCGDQSYEDFGGVETVRVRACQEGLRAALAVVTRQEQQMEQEMDFSAGDTNGYENVKGTTLFGSKNAKTGGSKDDVSFGSQQHERRRNAIYSKDIQTALAALQLSCPPKGSREYFVELSASALSKLSHYLTDSDKEKKTNNNNQDENNSGDDNNTPPPSIQQQNIQLLLHHSTKLIELRTLDSLLRILRDRHLIVATRLRRARSYWKWRLKLSRGRFGRGLYRLREVVVAVVPESMRPLLPDFRERNQREYERSIAAWEREVTWLGRVEKLLLSRPVEMGVGDLLKVGKDSGKRTQKRDSNDTGNAGSSNEEGWMSWLPNSVFGGGDNFDKSTQASLAESAKFLIQSKNRMWIRETEMWNRNARNVIKDALSDTIGSSFMPLQQSSGGTDSGDEIESKTMEAFFLEKWANYHETASDTSSWLSVLSLVDFAASTQRAGENQNFQITDLVLRIKRFDFLGIPSSALVLAGANALHDQVIAPHYQEILDFFKAVFHAIWGIVEFRFYTPMKDIVLDLLNRRPRMVDPFALMNEQTSLDNMLKDLGVGDGTRATRATALAAASRLYEEEVAGGAIRGLVRGKVVRLMLIQIQQLKADLLQAMDQIDNLVDANRLNVQLVASIPAVLILIFGSRALYLFWSNIRMKDLRLPKDVHADMSDYLKKVEECLILSNYELDGTFSSKTATTVDDLEKPAESIRSLKWEGARAGTCLGPKEMGQLLVLLHSYLNLLDYMSPPFPSKQCDSIHRSVQNLLMQGQMSTARQLDLLRVIQSKHAELLKSL